MDNQESDRAWKNALGQAGMVGMTLVVCIVFGAGAGIGLDHWLKTQPWFTLSFTVLGIIAGFYNVVRIVASLNTPAKKP